MPATKADIQQLLIDIPGVKKSFKEKIKKTLNDGTKPSDEWLDWFYVQVSREVTRQHEEHLKKKDEQLSIFQDKRGF